MLTSTLFGSMITSASIVIAFTFLQYYFYVWMIEEERERIQHLYLVLISAIAGLLAMTVAYQGEAGVILDTRFVPVLLLLIWGGRVPLLLPLYAAAVIGAERLLFSVDTPAVVTLFGMVLITALLILLNRMGLRERTFAVRARTHALFGNVLFTALVGFSGEYSWQVFFTQYAWIVLGVNFIATVIMVLIYEILYRDMRARKVLKVSAETDFLTGLSNRRTIDQYLNKELQQCGEVSDDLSLAILDIDHFKQINDTYGHEIGDQVLKRVAMLIRDHVRSTDFVGRYGGEEFVIVFPHLGLDVAAEIADRVRRMIERTPIVVGECKVSVTVSIGVSTLAEETEKNLRSAADERLYIAKKTGRNRTVCQGTRDRVGAM